jgi:hypothetical protein
MMLLLFAVKCSGTARVATSSRSVIPSITVAEPPSP